MTVPETGSIGLLRMAEAVILPAVIPVTKEPDWPSDNLGSNPPSLGLRPDADSASSFVSDNRCFRLHSQLFTRRRSSRGAQTEHSHGASEADDPMQPLAGA